MAIAFDATSQGSTASTTLSFSHTCTGSNRFLTAAIVTSRQSGSDPLGTVSYGGTNMTLSSSVVIGGSSANIYFYTLENPASGSNTFSATIGGSGTVFTFEAILASYTGVLQTSQPEANGTGTNAGGTTSQATLTTSSGAWLVGAGNSRAGSISSFSGTQRGTTLSQLVLADSNTALSAGSNSISFTGSSNLPDVVAISIAPVAVASLNLRTLMGAGI